MGEFSHIPSVFDNVSMLRMLHFFLSSVVMRQCFVCHVLVHWWISVLLANAAYDSQYLQILTYFALIFLWIRLFFVVTFPLSITTTSPRKKKSGCFSCTGKLWSFHFRCSYPEKPISRKRRGKDDSPTPDGMIRISSWKNVVNEKGELLVSEYFSSHST